MRRLIVEDGSDHKRSLANDLSRHLYARQWEGKIVVLTDTPLATLAAVRKQWMHVTQEVRRAHAMTLKAERIMELDATMAKLRRFRMTCRKPSEAQSCNVFYLTPGQLTDVPEDCHTVYVGCPLDEDAFKRLEERLPVGALVVRYQ